MSSPGTPTLQDLLAHKEFLRRLAVALASESDADDAVQETWLIAMQRPPKDQRNLRGWLRTVLRNVLTDRSRRRERRQALVETLERNVGAGEVTSSPARAQLLELVGRRLLALPEPYRSVLTLRYYEGRDRPEIAAALNRPLNTVNSQIRRGLEQLRHDLDAEGAGDRRAWTSALLAATTPEPYAAPGAAVAPVARLTALAVLVSAVGLTAVAWRMERTEDVPPAPQHGEALTEQAGRGPGPAGSKPERGAVAMPASESVTTNEVGVLEPSTVLEIEVVDTSGTPVPDAAILMFEPTVHYDLRGQADGVWNERGRTGVDGRIQVEVGEADTFGFYEDPRQMQLLARAPGRVASHMARVDYVGGSQVMVRLELGDADLRISGRVEDAGGTPILGAGLRFGYQDINTWTTEDGREFLPRSATTSTGENGAYEIAHLAPEVQRVRISAPGFVEFRGTIDGTDHSALELNFVLERGFALTGTVYGPSGDRAAGAVVWVQAQPGAPEKATTADPDGAFRLEGLPIGPRRLWAQDAENGSLLATEVLLFAGEPEQEWQPRLGARAPLRVRLIGPQGEPLAGWMVLFSAPTDGFSQGAVADAEGRVWLAAPPPLPLAAEVFLPSAVGGGGSQLPISAHDGLLASPDEYELVVPVSQMDLGSLRGRIADAKGHPVAATLRVKPHAREYYLPLNADADSGTFRVDEAAAGAYELFAWTGAGLCSLGTFEVHRGEERDLGILRLPEPRAIQLEFDWPEGSRYRLYQRYGAEGTASDWILAEGEGKPPETILLFDGTFCLDATLGGELLGLTWFETGKGQPTTVRCGP